MGGRREMQVFKNNLYQKMCIRKFVSEHFYQICMRTFVSENLYNKICIR